MSLIKREDAIKAIVNTPSNIADVMGNNLCLDGAVFRQNEIIDILKDIPSAEKHGEWIPCSERLPKKPDIYTVTDNKGDVVRFVFSDTESSREYWLRCAKAWMPLPSAYQGE